VDKQLNFVSPKGFPQINRGNSNRFYINNLIINTVTMVIDIAQARVNVEKKGFLDIEVDPTLDIFSELEKLKKEKNAVS
jgi:hypothetical protein